ncbi:hypothetical protein D3C78_1493160 [compost metagenome]
MQRQRAVSQQLPIQRRDEHALERELVPGRLYHQIRRSGFQETEHFQFRLVCPEDLGCRLDSPGPQFLTQRLKIGMLAFEKTLPHLFQNAFVQYPERTRGPTTDQYVERGPGCLCQCRRPVQCRGSKLVRIADQ